MPFFGRSSDERRGDVCVPHFDATLIRAIAIEAMIKIEREHDLPVVAASDALTSRAHSRVSQRVRASPSESTSSAARVGLVNRDLSSRVDEAQGIISNVEIEVRIRSNPSQWIRLGI